MQAEFEEVLKRLHRKGKKRFGDNWSARLLRRRAEFEAAYATLYEQNRDPIVYAPLSAQTTYVFAYAPTRAEYTRQFLLRHREALGTPLFTSNTIEVVSFGGGPASELVGLVRYLEDDQAGESVAAINYVVYDKDGDWEDVATDVVASLETDINITLRYEEANFSNARRMARISLAETDLVIFSYIMSELARVETAGQIAENFRMTLSGMKLNSKILFIDNKHKIFINFFKSCKVVAGLNQSNDDGEPVDCDFSDMTGTFSDISELLEWVPRTALNAVSKLIVRTRI